MAGQAGQARTAGTLTACQLVPFSEDLLAATARQVLEHHRDTLPDLTGCQILLPDTQCAPALRAALLREAARAGHGALLGPHIDTLEDWLARSTPPARTVLDRPARELILGEALRANRALYDDTDPWLLADELLALFDDMTLAEQSPDDFDAFRQRLQDAYGLRQPNPVLQREAWMLHTLWRAWREQLDAEDLTDPASARRERLQQADVPATLLWLVGFTRFNTAEARWLRERLARGEARLLLHGSAAGEGYHPHAPLAALLEQLGVHAREDSAAPADRFIDALFADASVNLRKRARAFAATVDSDPLAGRLRTLCADNPEQEAQAVALQVRCWLLERPDANIAIITGDRRLARRVRALLENSAIPLDDAGGWALSTTSAAALLERWLETVEEDFACGPLLDVLKSPFLSLDTRDTHLEQVRRLEQDIILHENIARGLDRYRYHLDRRSERLPAWGEISRTALHALLDRLQTAAEPLLALQKRAHPAGTYLEAIGQSLRALGAIEPLAGDEAGRCVLEQLDRLRVAATHRQVDIDWHEFRDWLGRNLERASFHPPDQGSPVRLLTLEQSRLQRFDRAIIAGCTREQLPGKPAATSFFNQRVRGELGLPTWSQTLAERLHHFCRALLCAGQVLLTRHREVDGEPVAPGPWLELLEVFHRNAFQASLEDRRLAALLRREEARPATPDRLPLPATVTRPAPRAEAGLLPEHWSASTHQHIIDCPYRFFAADTLRLKPPEEISEALGKADYGALVHRILQAFTQEVKGLPGPWKGALNEAHRESALQLLKQISETVFRPAIRDNFEARGWYIQWQAIMPAWLDWEIGRRAEWPRRESEVDVSRALNEHLRIGGRIDRLDRNASGAALLDYKTGSAPRADAVASGEAVQLPGYALAVDDVVQLDYLVLGRGKVDPSTCADAELLDTLLPALRDRLLALDEKLRAGSPLPAWGDAATCRWCEFSGLCRREHWPGEDDPHD